MIYESVVRHRKYSISPEIDVFFGKGLSESPEE